VRSTTASMTTAAAVAFASEHGASAMYLQVTEDNHAARRLYGAAGFADHHAYCYLHGDVSRQNVLAQTLTA
jgi:N-acetylglutamate synthase